MNKYWLVVVLVCALQLVHAQVLIEQVLYNPTNESGGEAVELKNWGSEPIDISGWIIATESSQKDATIPQNTILLPQKSFLIADEGWNDAKQDKSWKKADYEEKITLGNEQSGIALLAANGEHKDALGWGNASSSKAGLFSGSPATQVAATKALLRFQNTGDNSHDFVEAQPEFHEGMLVPLTAEVSIILPIIDVSKSINLAPEGVLVVKNNGETSIQIKLVLNDLYYKNYTIDKSALSLDGPQEFSVPAKGEYTTKMVLRAQEKQMPGKYTSTLRVVVE